LTGFDSLSPALRAVAAGLFAGQQPATSIAQHHVLGSIQHFLVGLGRISSDKPPWRQASLPAVEPGFPARRQWA